MAITIKHICFEAETFFVVPTGDLLIDVIFKNANLGAQFRQINLQTIMMIFFGFKAVRFIGLKLPETCTGGVKFTYT